ncbi:DNA mismatch repair protein MutT [Morganella morganii]|uniref:DNA mismatch repair protein MutT n=1 Tax=Morganella morganii TaxID=582 RepID=A0A433ZUF3_MORMO|nr:DNA mismatch repair protein MutT [Morganella morganii]
MVSDSHGRFLLHRHPKLGIWLPPGGHIEENEEPQAQQFITPLPEAGVLPLPMAILKEFIPDKKTGDHWHIDMVYWCRPLDATATPHSEFQWMTPDEILKTDNVPQDVCGLIAMVQARC